MMTTGCSMLGIKNIPVQELEHKYYDADSKILDIGGQQIRYRDEGQGPVLVLIHGVCASLHTWDGWVDQLRGHYRIIRMDLPGFGLSPLSDAKIYERRRAVAFLDKLFQALGVEQFYLAGNSLGGYLSWIYTDAYPEKVEKLILVDSAGFRLKMPWMMKFASTWPFSMFSRHMMPRFMMADAVEQVYGDPDRIAPGVRERYFELAMRPGGKSDYVDIFKALGREFSKPDVSEGISEIAVPTLVMWGEKDTWIPYPEQLEQWRQALPGAQFIIYAGAGHIPMEEIPVETARDAMVFLSEDTTAGAGQ
jgi:pimeloyl-ACP methyl ester carboxylesterase